MCFMLRQVGLSSWRCHTHVDGRARFDTIQASVGPLQADPPVLRRASQGVVECRTTPWLALSGACFACSNHVLESCWLVSRQVAFASLAACASRSLSCLPASCSAAAFSPAEHSLLALCFTTITTSTLMRLLLASYAFLGSADAGASGANAVRRLAFARASMAFKPLRLWSPNPNPHLLLLVPPAGNAPSGRRRGICLFRRCL